MPEYPNAFHNELGLNYESFLISAQRQGNEFRGPDLETGWGVLHSFPCLIRTTEGRSRRMGITSHPSFPALQQVQRQHKQTYRR